MKISREQKELNRQKLLSVGVELMRKVGLKEATLRQIAQSAGFSEPVIYKYFPSKDHLLAAYFDEAMKRAIAQVETQADFASISFIQQLHLLEDAVLAEYEPQKDFVKQAFQNLFLSGLAGSHGLLAENKRLFTSKVETWLTAAVAAGEFVNPPSVNILSELLWDFNLGLTLYWLKDDSESSVRSLQLLDHSLGLINDLLKSNILGRVTDLLFFLAREHFMKSVDKLTELTHDQKNLKTRFFNTDGKKESGRKSPPKPT
jgi:TetR/AcrR family transcriptional regulator of autoinduction and epiphytic fitness